MKRISTDLPKALHRRIILRSLPPSEMEDASSTTMRWKAWMVLRWKKTFSKCISRRVTPTSPCWVYEQHGGKLQVSRLLARASSKRGTCFVKTRHVLRQKMMSSSLFGKQALEGSRPSLKIQVIDTQLCLGFKYPVVTIVWFSDNIESLTRPQIPQSSNISWASLKRLPTISAENLKCGSSQFVWTSPKWIMCCRCQSVCTPQS